jgi:metal-dependent hydrolase (beta-lactamase superfamily II)
VNQDFTQDYGYAVHVSYEGKKFLMDTGTGKAILVKNMKAAGILLENLDFVFLSHAHPDHTGGLVF